MLWDVHSQKINIPVNLTSTGDTVVVAKIPDTWLYIHELIGSSSAATTLQIKSGSTVMHEFTLDAGQGLTLSDIAGEEGAPRFRIKPADDFIINVTAAGFKGGLSYSLRQ